MTTDDSTRDLVRAYYGQFDSREWDRLLRPEGVLEFLVISDLLERRLLVPGRILDIGGGPGRYTIWLAQRGHRVVLADLSPNLLAIARTRIAEEGVGAAIEELVEVDACNLDRYEDASFDAVLSLGPMYHLTRAVEREAAVAELYRILKPGGQAFIAFMPIYGFIARSLLVQDERRHLDDDEFMARLLEEGAFINDISGRFDSGFGIHAREVAPFMESHGFRTLEVLSDTGFAGPYAQQIQSLSTSHPGAYRRLLQLILKSAADPSILGSALHIIYAGEK